MTMTAICGVIGIAMVTAFLGFMVVWVQALPIIIIVGLKMGVFTPTEAGVVAAVYALCVSTVVYKELKFSNVFRVFVAASRTRCREIRKPEITKKTSTPMYPPGSAAGLRW